MYGYIYLTTNKVNGKQYIGKKVSDVFVKNYLGSGTYIRKAIKKYGKENFTVTIIEQCDDNESLNQRELYWISYYNAVNDDNFYNLAVSGEGFKKGMKFSSEHKKKLSEGKIGELNPNFNKKPNENQLKGLEIGWHKSASDKLKKKLSEIRTGIEVTQETRNKLSQNAKGRHYINNGKDNKMVYDSEMNDYLSNGWVRGRIKNY